MKTTLMIISFLFASVVVNAEEKTCTVKGMHCGACVDMVKDRVCNDTYEVCDLTIKEGKEKKGVLHIKTKDAKAKIDEAALAKAILADDKEDSKYKLDKCTAGAKAKATM